MNDINQLMKRLSKPLFIFYFLFFVSCGLEEPVGSYEGSIKDWAYEHFEGTIMANGKGGYITLVLRNTPDGLLSHMTFEHPDSKIIERKGKWDVGDGERVIRFNDGREPSEYFLIKRGVRFAFQSKDGLSNDDSSPILLMRNEGLSRKTSYPLKISFEQDRKVAVERGVTMETLKGEWKWAGDKIVISVELLGDLENKNQGDSETYKFFLELDNKSSDCLRLEKLVVMKPFLTKEGTKRQNWMSSVTFPGKPKLSKVL